MTTQKYDDYARIEAQLFTLVQEHTSQIIQAQNHINELNNELTQVEQHMRAIQAEQVPAQGEVTRLHKLVQEAAQEAHHAQGTSLHAAKQAVLKQLQAEHSAA